MSILCSMVGASFSLAATALVRTTITAGGNAQVSTAQSKFGGASALFDGTSNTRLTVAESISTTGAYTIEFWFRIATQNNGDLLYVQNEEAGRLVVFLNTSGTLLLDTYSTGTPDYSGGSGIATGFTTNTWYHFAYVRETSNTVKIYVDGILQQTGTSNVNLPTGGVWFGSRGYNGYMDEIRVSNTARYTTTFTPSATAFVNDANTLLLIHANGTNGSTVFTDDTGVTVTPAANSVNEGSSLTFNVTSVGAADQTLYYTLTNSGDFAVSSGSFSLTSNAGSFSVTPTADTTTEGAETFTASVRTVSTSGTIIATSSAVTINDTSLANAAVAFDGTDDYYSATGITSTATDGYYATVAITFYYDGSNGDFEGMLNLRLGAADSNWGLVIGLAGGTKVRLIRVRNNGSDGGEMYLDSAGDTALVTNGWNQVVFWHKGDNATPSTSKIWVNGVAQTVFFGGSMTNTSLIYNWGHTTGQVWIGRHTTDMIGGAQPFFKGRYSQIYIHNGQTSAPSISSFWNTTTNLPLDLGTNGTATGLAQPLIYHYGNTSTFPTNNGTGFSSYTLTQSGGVTGAAGATYGVLQRSAKTITASGNAKVSTAQSQFGGASALFDGTGDWLTTSASSDFNLSATNFTVEGWFWFTSAANGALASNYEYGTNNGFEIYKWSSGSFLLGTSNGASIGYVQSSTGSYSTSTWNHWAVTRTGSTMSMYCNGNRVYTTSSFNIDSWATPSNAIITIGKAEGNVGGTFSDTDNNAYAFDGYQDEIRVSNTVRYTGSTYTVPTAAFVNDANTILLVHCNGTNNSTSFTDDTA